MQLDNSAYIPTQVASAFIHIESYTKVTHLIISKADGDKTYIGRTYEMSPLTGGGSEFSGVIQNILKMAPDDSVVQVSLLCTPDFRTPYTLVKGKKYGNELLTELINRQSHLYENATSPDFLSNIPIINSKTLIISLMIPMDSVSDKNLEHSLETQNEFLGGLKSCGFYDVRTLSPGDLLAVYRQFANIYKPRQEVVIDELLDLRQQAYATDNIFDFRADDFAVFDREVFCSAVVPKALPLAVSHGLMNLVIGAPLNSGTTEDGGGLRVKTPFIITATVRVANQRKETERVALSIKSRERKEKLPFTLGAENTEEVLADLNYIQQICNDGTNKYTYASVTAFVFAKTKVDLVAARLAFKTTFNNLKFDARDVSSTIGVRFVQSLPLNFSPKVANKLVNEALMPASAAACLLPIFSDYQGNADLNSDRTGSVFLTRRGLAYHFDPFLTNGNKNGIIAAKSGVGKSFVTQYIISNELAQGTDVVLFDNGKSAKKFCKSVDGDFIEFDLNRPNKPSLNPFTGLTEREFDEQAEVITALILKMAYFNEPIEPGARIAVGEATKSAFGQKLGRADINTVIDSLAVIKESSAENASKSEVVIAACNLIPRLKNFIDSPARGPFFTGPSNLDPKNRFTVFELSALDGDEHLKQCILFFVMNSLMRKIKNTDGNKLIMLDEAWQLIKDEGAAQVMEGLYRKARKDGGSIWVITTSPRDLADSVTGQVILSQSTWKLVMEQEPEEIDKIVAEGVMTKFANDGFFNKLIKDIKTSKGVFSEILICGEANYEAVRLYVDRFTGALFSTDGDDRDLVFQMMDEGMSAIDAVNAVIGDTKVKRTKWLKNIISQLRDFEKLNNTEIQREIEAILNE